MSRSLSSPNSDRRAELAKIHLAKKQLRMDEDSYRDMLWTIAQVRSAADLDDTGRHRVIAHMRSCGAVFEPPRRKGQRPHNYDRLPEYVAKVEASLADMGLSWSYADRIAYHVTGGKGRPDRDPGVERLAWVKRDDHWRAVIAALHVEQEKRAKHETVLKMLRKAGKSLDYLDRIVEGGLPKNWSRRRRLMASFIEHLRTLPGGNDEQ